MDTLERNELMEEAIIDQLGEEATLEAIIRAMDYDTKQDIFEYIIRMYDLDFEEEEEEEE